MNNLTGNWARISVTKADIAAGSRRSASKNAVARAVRRALGIKNVEANESTVTVVVKGQSYVASLPKKVNSLFVAKAVPLAFSIRFKVSQ